MKLAHPSEPDTPQDTRSGNSWRAARAWAGRWAACLTLAAYLVVLLLRAWHARQTPFQQIDWTFGDAASLLVWVRRLLHRELTMWALAVVLGMLVPPAIVHCGRGRWCGRPWLRHAGGWGLGLLVLWSCFRIAWRAAPPPSALVLPFFCYLLGYGVASAALRGWRVLASFSAVAAVLGLVVMAAGLFMGRAAVSTSPFATERAPLTTAEKRGLAQRIRDSRPAAGQPRRIELTSDDINGLGDALLERARLPHQARVEFLPDAWSVQSSWFLPSGLRSAVGGQVVNFRMRGQLSVGDGVLRLSLEEFQAGQLRAPAALARIVSWMVYTALMDDPQLRCAIQAIDRVQFEPGRVWAEVEPGVIGRQLAPALVNWIWRRPDVAMETEVYVRHLVALATGMGDAPDRFGKLFRAAFELAAMRSRDHDPVLENRAALFALAILLGHEDLEPFVGEFLDDELRDRARGLVETVTLRGRADLPRHFLVSAALLLLTGEANSDRLGLIKEKIDARDGGSGFSFVDLLANMAGNRFAEAATRDSPSARVIQERWKAIPDVNALMPPWDGLPENIGASAFRQEFGGMGGAGYEAQLRQIRDRLDKWPAVVAGAS